MLVKKVSDPRMTTIVDKLVAYAGSNDDQLRDLAGLCQHCLSRPSETKLTYHSHL